MSQKTDRKMVSGIVALKKIVEGTSEYTGTKFFRELVKNLAELLDAHGVWVTEYLRDQNRLRSIAFWLNGQWQDTYEYDVPGTPCEPVLKNKGLCHIPDKVIRLYPNDPDLKPLGAVSYMGFGLRDDQDQVMGHLALLDNKPMEEIPEAFALFKIFAVRAEAELKRLRYEKLLVENEAKLKRLVNGAMDALIEFNSGQLVTQVNDAACRTFKTQYADLVGRPVRELLDADSLVKLRRTIQHLDNMPQPFCSTLVQGQITFIGKDRKSFPAEATLSRYQYNQQDYFALFIRNVEDRIKDQLALKQLHVEADMLREKVSSRQFNNIIGSSKAIQKVISMINQVATTPTTVLIRGETGTGKELIARAIHEASQRKDQPLITLNCAALPTELVESELFGHIKGAFTGATTSREGRFMLADTGTIFLDEIGELPLPLQAKLLRVLQEGEFEPVGSSKTKKVDVRVIAATNRDLENEVKAGTFRQDLFYRLNVFPISVPPLRERKEDILELANAFREKFARQSALSAIKPFSTSDIERLQAYSWPGNVRELQNIIERAIITHQNGHLNLSGLSSEIGTAPDPQNPVKHVITESERIIADRENVLRALQNTGWKISGPDGAAALLEIPATTLKSRMDKLGIVKPLN